MERLVGCRTALEGSVELQISTAEVASLELAKVLRLQPDLPPS